MRFARGWSRFGSCRARWKSCDTSSAALRPGISLRRAAQAPSAPSPVASFGSLAPGRADRATLPPTALGLSVAILNGEQFLLPVRTGADHHQGAEPGVLAESDGEVHTVHPHVGVAPKAQVSGTKAAYSFCQVAVSRWILVGDSPAGILAQRFSERGRKSPVDSPRRYGSVAPRPLWATVACRAAGSGW